jgi:hypothetical protein
VRVKNEDVKWLPLRLIMSMVRERGGVINYKIPITGNLKNPRFHLRDVAVDLFENIFIKPSTIPYGLEVKKNEKGLETFLGLTWNIRQSTLEPRQEKFIKKVAEFLKENKDASIDVYPNQYAAKEKEHILYFETKKNFFLLAHNKKRQEFTKNDSIEVDKMSVKNLAHALTKDMKKMTRDTTMFTIQDKCHHYLGNNSVDIKYEQLLNEREKSFRSFFVKNGTDKQVKIHKSKNTIPYNGFSYYEFKYKGEIPKALQESYEAMHKLNNRLFRKKYFN